MELEIDKVDVCDFCYSQHVMYAKGLKFYEHKKRSVTICTCCNTSMCEDCNIWSQNEIKGSILEKYWFALCKSCINQYWRQTDMQEVLEKKLYQEINKVKITMKDYIYTLHDKQCVLQKL